MRDGIASLLIDRASVQFTVNQNSYTFLFCVFNVVSQDPFTVQSM